eukprot:CAMPEP_0178410742 /NCGR_PEP_ID=MMETSP0689_2-20121128/21141_1 /TAXON_ID=160604 /ORGANISM="Amphidinium massartii, Strain CS-259" /LENGTH=85 /DNA_ID=CAMNT_0020031937 /DNA_START=282 /DNA_END=539 /DNA_ORIENTATION=-
MMPACDNRVPIEQNPFKSAAWLVNPKIRIICASCWSNAVLTLQPPMKTPSAGAIKVIPKAATKWATHTAINMRKADACIPDDKRA